MTNTEHEKRGAEAMKINDETDAVREMDAFFRREFRPMDFAAEAPDLEGRLWQKIQERICIEKKEKFTMANINKKEFTKEQIEMALGCETVEELLALAKEGGVEMTKEEAEAYMAELEDFELDDATLKNVAGGRKGGGGSFPKVY